MSGALTGVPSPGLEMLLGWGGTKEGKGEPEGGKPESRVRGSAALFLLLLAPRAVVLQPGCALVETDSQGPTHTAELESLGSESHPTCPHLSLEPVE